MVLQVGAGGWDPRVQHTLSLSRQIYLTFKSLEIFTFGTVFIIFHKQRCALSYSTSAAAIRCHFDRDLKLGKNVALFKAPYYIIF